MEYSVGDEVMVKAKITSVLGTAYTADCSCGNFYLKNEDILHEPQMTAEEAWEIAKKILLYPAHGGFNDTELEEIFGRTEHLLELTPQEAKAKIEAWEAEKEIKVGDVVIETSDAGNEYIGVVTQITSTQNSACIVYTDGSTNITLAKNLKKTGRHIDINGLLKQIGGNE